MRQNVLAVLLTLIFAATVQAAELTETPFSPGDVVEGDMLGKSAAMSGSIALFGAPGKNEFQGAAYLFDAATGAQIFEFDASGTLKKGLLGTAESFLRSITGEGAALEQFGNSVAISGTTALVGAQGSVQLPNYSGAAYVFDAATGQRSARLVADDGAGLDGFGSSVAISSTIALVGAMQHNNKQGAAYLFDLATGTQTAKLTASDAANGDFFGFSAAISGTTTIVGAFGKEKKQGAAYLFDIVTGKQIATLTASDAAEGDGFGISVAISGTTVIVGSVSSDGKQGAAYLFDTTTGKQTAKLTASDAAKYQQFGSSVAVFGNTAIVGANGFNLDGGGAVYLFNTSTGRQTAKLTPSDAKRGNYFGSSVALSESAIVVGAKNSNANSPHGGAAYLFRRP